MFSANSSHFNRLHAHKNLCDDASHARTEYHSLYRMDLRTKLKLGSFFLGSHHGLMVLQHHYMLLFLFVNPKDMMMKNE